MASDSRLPSSIHHHHLPPINSSSFYLTGDSMFSFEDVNERSNSCNNNKRTFFQSFEQEDIAGDDQDYSEYFNQSGKKRRLSLEQLKFLEKSFEMDNKLEPDRKLHLANDLGLQPRQVAIWFQNRRARWKTKQMEMDYDVLQQSFDSLKASYDNLCREKEHLKSQIALLAEECAQKQKNKCTTVTPNEESKLEEHSTSPAKINNGILDSYSTSTANDEMFETDNHYYYINVCSGSIHSPHMEHVDSVYMLEPDNSDLSQDEDVDRACFLPKLEPVDYSLDASTSINFSFPAFWSWSF